MQSEIYYFGMTLIAFISLIWSICTSRKVVKMHESNQIREVTLQMHHKWIDHDFMLARDAVYLYLTSISLDSPKKWSSVRNEAIGFQFKILSHFFSDLNVSAP